LFFGLIFSQKESKEKFFKPLVVENQCWKNKVFDTKMQAKTKMMNALLTQVDDTVWNSQNYIAFNRSSLKKKTEIKLKTN